MRRLNFHKALGNGKFRLPKITKAQQETYESLYKVGKLIQYISDKRPHRYKAITFKTTFPLPM